MNKKSLVDEVIEEARKSNEYDVLGQYSGMPENPLETPTQDADDL